MMKFLIMLGRGLVKYRCNVINDGGFVGLTIEEIL